MSPEADSVLFEKSLESLGRQPTSGPRWLGKRKDRAAEVLRASGLPHNRLEEWRFTSLRPVKALAFEPNPDAPELPGDVVDRVLPEGVHPIIVVNGRVQTHTTSTSGVKALGLVDALRESPGAVEPHLFRLSGDDGGFSAQNAALFEDAVVITIPKSRSASEPLFVVHVVASTDTPTGAYPRLLVIGEESSSAHVVEVFVSTGTAPRFSSAVAELVLQPNAQLEHTRLHIGTQLDYVVGSVYVEQHRDARYTSRVFSLGGALTRLDLDARLVGEGAECNFDGLYLASKGDHVDHHTRVEHRVPRATSHQLYKGVLDGGGHAVFDGTIVVARGASGSDAHQKNENLLLSDDAVVHTKPHLEIDTDDVACSHGTTVGRLDENQVFYLQSRGIDEPTARAVLVDAFAREMIDRVSNEALRDKIAALIAGRKPSGDLARRLPS